MDGDAAPHGPIWHGATVLVVDDDPSVRQILRRMLEAEGFHVEEAQDGESALRLVQARAETFDLVPFSSPGFEQVLREVSSPEGAPPKRVSPAERAAAFHRGHADASPSDC
jgi:DNA-binding NtrC family response regulator